VDPSKPTRVAIVHGAAAEDAQALRQEVEKMCEPVEVIVSAITPVLGVHGGPGVVCICAYND
jgi:fatty acid-binding protein DegV